MHKKRFIPIIIALLLVTLLSGCNVVSDRTEKPGPDWSRALYLGRASLRQPPTLQVDAQGHVHIAWYGGDLYYAHLDAEAHILTNTALDLESPNPRRPQLFVDGQDKVHLVWLSRQGDEQRLYHCLVGPSGETTEAVLLSQEGSDVSSFVPYLTADKTGAVVWANEDATGSQTLVHAAIDHPGETTVLVEGAIDPYVLVDPAGTTHVAWMVARGLTARTVYYAAIHGDLDNTQERTITGTRLADFEYAEGAVYYGPVIGLDSKTVYVLWSVQNLGGGLTPTAAFSYYVAFPLGQPALTRPQAIGLPTATRPDYEAYDSAYGLTELDVLSPVDLRYGSDFVNTPATVSSQAGELPVAFSLMTASQSSSEIQLATVVLSGGKQIGYQLASKTTNASLMPALASDAEQNLHLVWIDTAGFREYDVYYASMAPQSRRWLDRTSTDDLVLGAADILFGILSGIGLLPIAGIWSFPPTIWIVLFYIFSGQEELERRGAKIGLGIGILIYIGMKILLLPGLFAGTPFLHLVSPALAVTIGIAVPVVILLLALLVVFIYARRADRATIFRAFFIFVLVDVALTLVLYAPGFFGRA